MGLIDFDMTNYTIGVDYAVEPSNCVVVIQVWKRSGPTPLLCDDGRVENIYGPFDWHIISDSRSAARQSGGEGGE